MSEWKFVFAYLSFLAYFLIIIALGGPTLISVELGEITPPQCNLADPLVFIKCPLKNLDFFFKLLMVSTTVKIFGTVILVLTGVMAYIILRMIRGGG